MALLRKALVIAAVVPVLALAATSIAKPIELEGDLGDEGGTISMSVKLGKDGPTKLKDARFSGFQLTCPEGSHAPPYQTALPPIKVEERGSKFKVSHKQSIDLGFGRTSDTSFSATVAKDGEQVKGTLKTSYEPFAQGPGQPEFRCSSGDLKFTAK